MTSPPSLLHSSSTSFHPYGYGLSHRGFLPRPKLTTTLWEDERTICFQVDANGICVARREDNDMINGTKLLNVAGMSRGKRDGILKNEKGRVVVKVGAMHLKGVWITFERAKALSTQFKIQDILYPLFVDNPQTFLYSHPISAPISRLGSFRPYYPWDRLSSSDTPSIASDQHHDSGTSYAGYRPSPSNHYGGNQSGDVLLDYRSSAGANDSSEALHTNDHVDPTSSSYYPEFMNNNHRTNELAIYDPASQPPRDKPLMQVVTETNMDSSHPSAYASGTSGTFGYVDTSSTHLSGVSPSDPTSTSTPAPPKKTSAFQPLDTPGFHHPQPLYMDPSTTNSNPSLSNVHSDYIDSPPHHDSLSLKSYHPQRPSSRTYASQRHHPYGNNKNFDHGKKSPYSRPFSPPSRDEVKSETVAQPPRPW
ncbi:apses-domain-containing protein [Hesseltinella vesiculosa]|uniref:Apses-domain-containing protein n=1 Tax=Hesseltinella vesiculosa TaxID=101127 RepID=A0A1X2GXD3_9FUNG|nr:apses-domain-containing protein [Hesseltinella vesiculosa]